MALRNTLNESNGLNNISLCNESLNSSCVKFVYPTAVRVPLYAFAGAAMLLTMVGNMLVIVTVIHFRQLRTPTNMFTLSLALADLAVGGISMPFGMIRSVETCWYFGTLFCKIQTGLDIMCVVASILNLTIISFDRYYAIHQPLLYKSKITMSVALIVVCTLWIVSAAYAFTTLFLEFADFKTCEGSCDISLMFSLPSTSVGAALFILLPSMIFLIMYLKILFIAQKQAQSIQHMNAKASVKQPSSKVEMKATKTLGIVMGVFLLSWIPYTIVFTVDAHLGYVMPLLVHHISAWTGYLNSTFNPVVYAYFYSWFRRAFQIIVSGKIFQQNSSRILLF